ncbi:MAG: polyprenyl synthetase family protein [Desulfonauticus sp.]|nr:polyprenyl synthetase family protein [Desulfonauticus sp.]
MSSNNFQLLQQYFKQEIPKINACLEAEVKFLPPYIGAVARHVLDAGGKRLRPILTILVARALGYKEEDIYPLACALEIFHSATLIHDDILDNACLRRGQTAAHLVFGIKKSVLAGDGLLALGNMIVARYNKPVLNKVVSEAILATAYGEIQEIAVAGRYIDEKTYLEIITGKTAVLIQAACECGAIVSGQDVCFWEAARTYGLNMGIAFQLIDDALDYLQVEEKLGKPRYGDLKEGKITLPLILYLNSLDGENRDKLLGKILEQQLTSNELESIIFTISERQIGAKVKNIAQQYIARARKALLDFPENQETDLLSAILNYIVEREK